MPVPSVLNHLEQCSTDDTHMFIKYSPIGAHCHQQHAKKSGFEKIQKLVELKPENKDRPPNQKKQMLNALQFTWTLEEIVTNEKEPGDDVNVLPQFLQCRDSYSDISGFDGMNIVCSSTSKHTHTYVS